MSAVSLTYATDSAAGYTSIGVYADQAGTQSELSVSSNQPFDVYLVLRSNGQSVDVSAWSATLSGIVGSDPVETGFYLTGTDFPAGSIDFGGGNNSYEVGVGSCQTVADGGTLLLATLHVFTSSVFEDGTMRVLLGGFETFPKILDCASATTPLVDVSGLLIESNTAKTRLSREAGSEQSTSERPDGFPSREKHDVFAAIGTVKAVETPISVPSLRYPGSLITIAVDEVLVGLPTVNFQAFSHGGVRIVDGLANYTQSSDPRVVYLPVGQSIVFIAAKRPAGFWRHHDDPYPGKMPIVFFRCLLFPHEDISQPVLRQASYRVGEDAIDSGVFDPRLLEQVLSAETEALGALKARIRSYYRGER